MNVRLIAGKFGGRSIEGSDSDRTHPMSERIRNALFNIIGQKVVDARVLDAFAGSGSIGLEALSRGARQLTLIERDRIAIKNIEKNIVDLGVANSTTLIKTSVENWLSTSENESYDIIVADPPYYDPQLSTVMKLAGLLKSDGLMVISYPGRREAPTANGIVVVDNRSYGTAALAFYRKEDA